MTIQTAAISTSPDNSQSGSLTKIAIVGRGFTGIMNAIALLKSFERPFHLVMYDPSPRINGGEGVSRAGKTVLNSRVKDLSVDPSDRVDFKTWLQADEAWRSHQENPEVVDHSFVSREVFSAYVYERFSEALRARTDVIVQICTHAVFAIDRDPNGGLLITAQDQQKTHFDAVFLATGYGVNGQTDEARATEPAENVVVIGGGVHAVDRALKLLEAGEAAHVTLISSSGFLPQPHTRSAVGSVSSGKPMPRTLRGAFRFLREAAETAEREGSGWQGIMNDFRSRAGDLWKGLTTAERRRFKRHVKPIYDSHRNRLPPAHHRRLQDALAKGAITVSKGKVDRVAVNGVLLSTAAGLQVIAAERTIDCRIRSLDVDTPLFRSLFSSGLVLRDELELGIFVDRSGRALAVQEEFGGIFAVGPLGLGSLPDIDLVPEIVLQAYTASATLQAWLGTAVTGEGKAAASGQG